MQEDDIVITGFSAYLPQADHLVEFKEKLYAGVDMVTLDDVRWPPGHLGIPKRHGKIRDLSRFDAQFFGVNSKPAHAMDPQIRLLLETSYEAIVDAGYDPVTLRGRKVGVFVGASFSDTANSHRTDPTKSDGYTWLGSSRAFFSNRISYSFDFHGPSVTVDTACSSSMTAFNEALLALRSGRCEAAIVGGSNVTLDPVAFIKFARLGLLSPKGRCAAFDIECNGYVRSETVGCFFVQRASAARRVYARVINVKANADGYKVEGITYPSGRLQAQLLREVYAEANVDPRTISYVEAHGTGTKAGDPQELGAIHSVFCQPGRDKPLKIGSVKTNVGHAEASSGMAAMAKVILTMETGSIPPNLHFNKPNPDIPSLHDGSLEVVTKVTPFDGGLIGINSFGFGGANVHVILEANPGPSVDTLPLEKPELPRLVLMAGRSKDSLANTLNRLEAEGPYPDPTYALLNRVGQPSVKQFPYRGYALVPVDGGAEMEVVKVVDKAPYEKRPIWFTFTGMGCQWNGMARQMMHFDIFSSSIRKCHEALKPYGVDLIDLVTNEEARKGTIVSALVSITAIQVALVDMLRAIGVQPDGIVGHSIGESGSAYADGGFTAEQAVLCSYWQGRCTELENPPKGAMAAIGLTWEEAEKRCPQGVYPACHNAEDSVTVSGPAEAVAKMVAELKAENIFAREVDSLGVAFHSKHIHSIAPALRQALAKVVPEPKPRTKRWVSSSVPESRWQEPVAQLCSAEYYVNNFCSSVRFYDAIQHVPQNAIMVEIGPHCLLLSILKRALGCDANCLGLMKRSTDNLAFFLSSLGNLHTLGVKMDLSPLYPPVPWPLPRGTPNIGHLVSWDHSEKWTVAGWKDFSIVIQKTFVVDMENNEADKYLADHLIDGRLVFPATGYMVLAWKCLASRFGKQLKDIPVVFEDVSIWRATTLLKTGSVLFEVNLMPVSGEFEVCEGKSVVARGRCRLAENGEKIFDKDPPGAPEEEVAYDLDSEGIYKELKLRGYEHHGAFRGILKADLQKPYAKLKWEDNWVAFLSSMLQLFILGHPLRTFLHPVRIQSCRIDPSAHAQVFENVGEEGLDAVHSWHLNTCRAGGVELKGLTVGTAQRRPVQLTPVVEEYRFVPYEDDQEAIRERECHVREYADVCCGVARRILESYGEERGGFYSVINGYREVPEQGLNGYLGNRAENDGLLQVLVTILNEASTSTSLATAAHSVTVGCMELLEEDFLNTVFFEEDPLRNLIDVLLENTDHENIRVLELAAGGHSLLMANWVHRYLSLHSTELKTEYIVAHPFPNSLSRKQVPEGVKTIRWQPSLVSDEKVAGADLVVVARGVATAAVDGPNTLAQDLSSLCKERGFLLLSLRTSLTGAEEFLSTVSGVTLRVHAVDATAAALKAHGFRLVGRKSNNISSLLLYRKMTTPVRVTRQEVIRVKNDDFNWVEALKMKAFEHDSKPAGDNIWLVSEDVGSCGMVGLISCLRKETGGNHVRCVFDVSAQSPNRIADFSPSSPAYRGLLERDLVMNVYQDGRWGSYRHQSIPWHGALKTTTEFTVLSVQRPGDLSSLEWFESPLRYASPRCRTAPDQILCDVYFAPINFRDVMMASGKLQPNTEYSKLASLDCAFGLEVSGRDRRGRRIMGVVPSQGVATVALMDPLFLWEVPRSWTLEEASTVPVAYSTAYYALLVRGNLKEGESLLIHAGSGDVGQAAIVIAFSMRCSVFTTVGSREERELLKRRFPQLEDRHFSNSQDLSFEEHVLTETKGKGVDVVLNSLAEDKLEASVRCLAPHGRFLEIGRFDSSKNSALGMSVFLKNITFHGVLLDRMMSDDPCVAPDKRQVAELVRQGIASGTVRPLESILFERHQVEEAFRAMVSGKRIGKVVIQVRPEETDKMIAVAPPLKLEVIARRCFYEHKSYIIVGGLGDFGLELAEWMVTRGCRKLLLVSQYGVRTGYQRLCLHRWQSIGAMVVTTEVDASCSSGARQIVQQAASMGPVGGLFFSSAGLQDVPIENQTAETFEITCKLKVAVTQRLDALSREVCPDLDHFVVISSMASGRGEAGHTNYGYANSAAERICERRVTDRLPGLAIQWQDIGDVDGDVQSRISSCVALMDSFLSQSHPVVACSVEGNRSQSNGGRKRDLIQYTTKVLGIEDDPSGLNPNVSLSELGMNFLMSVEISHMLEREYDLIMSLQEVRELTITQLQKIGEGQNHSSTSQ